MSSVTPTAPYLRQASTNKAALSKYLMLLKRTQGVRLRDLPRLGEDPPEGVSPNKEWYPFSLET